MNAIEKTTNNLSLAVRKKTSYKEFLNLYFQRFQRDILNTVTFEADNYLILDNGLVLRRFDIRSLSETNSSRRVGVLSGISTPRWRMFVCPADHQSINNFQTQKLVNT